MNHDKILIVDDSKSTRLMLSEILETDTNNISFAEDGLKAFDLIKSENFDIVIMDIEMPGPSGLEITRRIRNELKLISLPIIILTQIKKPDLIQTAFEHGATDYINKPLNPDEIIARVKIRINHCRLEKQLRDTTEQLKKSNRAKSTFISHLAHELKTPLNAISGYTQLIMMELENKNHIEYCQQIMDSIKHQDILIKDTSNLVQIEAGVVDYDITEVDLSQIIKESIQMIQPLAQQLKITINLPKRSAFKHRIKADFNRLKQVIINLLSNAVKYNSENGFIDFSLKKETEYLMFGISDSGIGIATDYQQKIFEPFIRIKQEKNIEGTGLGLSVSKRIIQAMGGDLILESEPDKGSTFWLKLKL